MQKEIKQAILSTELKLRAEDKEIREELDIAVTDAAAQGAKKQATLRKDEIAEAIEALKKEVAASLHISGRYDMEMKADDAKKKGYARTFGEHVWKTNRNMKEEMDKLNERLN